ncbi:MAG TPA: glycerol-3-phosphate acyltransferase [Anaerolineae bacterium]|nr:glycerol-3-phosphate acyltransferase [Anaerolineae bacterium]
MDYILAVAAIFVAYLFGSIPVGYLVARMYGVDVTASGSGRIGGTNVLRSVGPAAAGLTVLGDILKGLVPVYLLATVAPPLVTALAAAAAVLGHNYSIFLRFRGGVGAGTAMGALGGLSFPAAMIVAICGLVALGVSRYASILSATIAVSTLVVLTVFALLGYTPYEYIIFGVLNLAVIFYALRDNFARLRAGTERKVGQKPENIVRVSAHHRWLK